MSSGVSVSMYLGGAAWVVDGAGHEDAALAIDDDGLVVVGHGGIGRGREDSGSRHEQHEQKDAAGHGAQLGELGAAWGPALFFSLGLSISLCSQCVNWLKLLASWRGKQRRRRVMGEEGRCGVVGLICDAAADEFTNWPGRAGQESGRTDGAGARWERVLDFWNLFGLFNCSPLIFSPLFWITRCCLPPRKSRSGENKMRL